MHYVVKRTYQFIPYYAIAIHKHTRTWNFKPLEDSHLKGLKVDIARLPSAGTRPEHKLRDQTRLSLTVKSPSL